MFLKWNTNNPFKVYGGHHLLDAWQCKPGLKDFLRNIAEKSPKPKKRYNMNKMHNAGWVLLMIVAGVIIYNVVIVKDSPIQLPDLPLHISVRKSIMPWSGYVAQFTSEADKTLVFTFVCCGYRDGKLWHLRNNQMKLDPGQTKEIGWNEGWEIHNQDQILTGHEGYKIVYWLVSTSDLTTTKAYAPFYRD